MNSPDPCAASETREGRDDDAREFTAHLDVLGPSQSNRPAVPPDPFSALEGTRTPNLLIRSQMLYPLSYERVCRAIA
jgi:hypothetical protein